MRATMGILDIFKVKQYKTELENLQHKYKALDVEMEVQQQQYHYLKTLLTPQMQEPMALQQEIHRLKNELAAQQEQIEALEQTLDKKKQQISDLDDEIKSKRKYLVSFDDEILVQEFGLYTPRFDFANALGYKEALSEIRAEQKLLIKEKKAVIGNTNWTVNNSVVKGRKMVSDTQKLLLRAFNTECDELIRKVKYTNFSASLNRINKSAEAISKLGSIMNIFISYEYLKLKEEELCLAFEYQLKKQQEKEETRAARAEQREQAKIQKELEERRHKLEKEQIHYQTAYEKLNVQLLQRSNDTELLKKQEEIKNTLSDIQKALADVDYRQANMRAGYVYIISNIGSFGKNIYKIGMTIRLDPQERIDELGGASVPFKFDVHAMIFSDDAPALETALHKAFEDKKVNLVNQRREFFYVTLDEIKEVIQKNFDKTVEFIDVADAEQYRISMKMRDNKE